MGSIIIALPRQETARKIKEILLRHGFGDTIVVSTAAAALQEIGRLSHGIVISGTKLPDMDYTDLLDCLPRYFDKYRQLNPISNSSPLPAMGHWSSAAPMVVDVRKVAT